MTSRHDELCAEFFKFVVIKVCDVGRTVGCHSFFLCGQDVLEARVTAASAMEEDLLSRLAAHEKLNAALMTESAAKYAQEVAGDDQKNTNSRQS